MNLPAVGQVTEASPEKLCLSFRLVLDKSVVTSVMVESSLGYAPGEGGGVRGIDVNPPR